MQIADRPVFRPYSDLLAQLQCKNPMPVVLREWTAAEILHFPRMLAKRIEEGHANDTERAAFNALHGKLKNAECSLWFALGMALGKSGADDDGEIKALAGLTLPELKKAAGNRSDEKVLAAIVGMQAAFERANKGVAGFLTSWRIFISNLTGFDAQEMGNASRAAMRQTAPAEMRECRAVRNAVVEAWRNFKSGESDKLLARGKFDRLQDCPRRTYAAFVEFHGDSIIYTDKSGGRFNLAALLSTDNNEPPEKVLGRLLNDARMDAERHSAQPPHKKRK